MVYPGAKVATSEAVPEAEVEAAPEAEAEEERES